MSALDFKAVIPAVQAGDKTARDALMAAFYAWSVAQTRLVARDPELAKDIAVGFWEWLFTEKGVLQYDASKGAFYPWMAAQLRYRALDAVKQKQPQVMYFSEVQDPDSYDPLTQLGAMQDLETIAEKLHGAQKDVFWRLLEGASVEEIAEECGVSTKRARNLIGEVRKVIRTQIGET